MRGAPHEKGAPMSYRSQGKLRHGAQFSQRPLGEGLTMILWVVVTREREEQVGGLC